MKKLAVLFIYFCVFWLFLPVALFYFGKNLDRYFQFVSTPNPARSQIGFLLAVVSGVLLLETVRQFRKYGGAWPVSSYPPNHLIRDGLFSWWRHPIYLFFDLTLLGLGLCFGSKGFLLIVYPSFLLLEYGYIRWEETRLEKRFPNEYPYYRRTTGLVMSTQLLRIPFHFLFAGLFRYRKQMASTPLPKPPFFVVAYHRNYLDPLFIAKAIPIPISYITTFEIFRGSLSRFIFRKLFSIPTRRFRTDITCVRQVARTIESGGVIGVFPEGERSWTGDPCPFKPEVLKLFRKFSSIPILPARISGNYHAWPRWGNRLRRAEVKVTLGEPFKFPLNAALTDMELLLANALKTNEGLVKCRSKNFAEGLSNLIYRCPVCLAFETLSQTKSNQTRCSQCGALLSLEADYFLVFKKDGNTVRQSLRDVYRNIRVSGKDLVNGLRKNSAAVQLKTGEKYLEEMEYCEVSETECRKFRLLSYGSLVVTNERIFSPQTAEATIPLSQVRSITIEGNRKLQLYLAEERRLFQIFFKKGSALRWHDFLVCLMKIEHNITPNHFEGGRNV